jgi:Tol biopolymer transport system component
MCGVRFAPLALLALGGCGHPAPIDQPQPPLAATIVVSESGLRGGQLVVLDASGDRLAELFPPPREADAATAPPVRDTQVAFSPDGNWVVFASSRDRLLAESSLWGARAVVGATPFRITTGRAIDLQPTWTADGRALVFASNRSGNLDLWQLELELAADQRTLVARGEPRAITATPEIEWQPTVAADGRIAFAEISAAGDVSRIGLLTPDGAGGFVRTALTAGPADTSPAFAPDGATLAFARPTLRIAADAATTDAVVDADLWLRAADGAERKLLDLGGTDESGAVWSADGGWLFAASVLRDPTGRAVLSSVVHVEVGAQAPVARILRDRAGTLARTSPAVAPVELDVDALRACPEYRDELARIVRAALEAAPPPGAAP